MLSRLADSGRDCLNFSSSSRTCCEGPNNRNEYKKIAIKSTLNSINYLIGRQLIVIQSN